MKKTLIAALALVFAPTSFASEPVSVVASFSILGNLVEEVGGERVVVSNLVGADQDAHVYQPTPQDVKKLSTAKMFVVNGLGFEGWLERLQESSGYKGRTLIVSRGIQSIKTDGDRGHSHQHAQHQHEQHGHTHQHKHEDGHEHEHHHHHHGDVDPHAWHDINNTIIYVSNITRALTRLDPAGKNYYAQRSDRYIQTLKALDQRWTKALQAIPVAKRRAITSHDAFAYLGRKYQIQFSSPQGVSTESEASAKQVAKLIEQIRKEKIRALFVENMSQPRVLEQIAKETGVSIGGKLYSDALSKSEQANTYVKMMEHNLSTLTQALKP